MVERFRRTVAFGVLAVASALSALDVQCLAQSQPAVSSSLVSASESSEAAAPGGSGKAVRAQLPNRDQQHVDLYEGPVRPFSSVAVGGNIGMLGIGGEITTHL